jgi:hypothetical protein
MGVQEAMRRGNIIHQTDGEPVRTGGRADKARSIETRRRRHEPTADRADNPSNLKGERAANIGRRYLIVREMGRHQACTVNL